jgi:PKD repeat protein
MVSDGLGMPALPAPPAVTHMKQRMVKAVVGVVAAALSMSACTTKSQEAPPLGGPSEFGQSVSVSVNPDSLPQDGASQSFVTVTVRDADAQPMRGVTLRVETRVNGVPLDFGRLSARSIVTGSDGRATLVYTAPAAPATPVDTFTIVDVTVTPSGSDFNNANSRSAAIRLTPPNDVFPPSDLRAAFTANPAGPEVGQTVLFDASTSQGSIVDYRWNFGDGSGGSGRAAQHAFSAAGTYVVSLTITDPYGRTATTSQTFTVGLGARPSAEFTFSPTAPRVGQGVNFNASASIAPNSRIVSYTWDFGDGTPVVTVGEPTIQHAFATAATYNVTLVVTDAVGRTSTGKTNPVAIIP